MGVSPSFLPSYGVFFNFSWRVWLHPALSGAQLGEGVMSLSSAVASHHHLPEKHYDPFKLPAVNCSADCSLTWFSQTHQVQLKCVNICSSKAPTRCWSRPGSHQAQTLSPSITALTLLSYRRSAPPQICRFNCCVFLKTPILSEFWVCSTAKERNWPKTEIRGGGWLLATGWNKHPCRQGWVAAGDTSPRPATASAALQYIF